MVLVAAVLYGIVPGIVKVGGWFELFFVNTLGLSFNSGVIVYIILLAACLIWGVYESYTEKEQVAHGTLVHLTIAMLGIPFYGHGGSSVVIGIIVTALLWLYLQTGYAGEDQREISRIGTHTEHITIVHHDDCHRIFIIRTYRDPLHRQYADGPELLRRISSRWANTWDANNMVHARCSTVRHTPHR